jgi:hypothetical protein
MARRRLIDTEQEESTADERRGAAVSDVIGAPRFDMAKADLSPKTGLRRNVRDVKVHNPTRLLTVSVGPTGNAFDGIEQQVKGAIVRLRPVGPSTADDMRWAEETAQKLGALQVVSMPIAAAGATFETPQDEELALEDAEGDVITMRDAMCGRLQSTMVNERCSADEVEQTLALANQMLERAGG